MIGYGAIPQEALGLKNTDEQGPARLVPGRDAIQIVEDEGASVIGWLTGMGAGFCSAARAQDRGDKKGYPKRKHRRGICVSAGQF